MNAKTCFDILCISRNASLEEAKHSYKKLVKIWHPDQYGNDPEKQRVAHDKLTDINIAYRELVAILKNNPERRAIPPEPEETNPHRFKHHPIAPQKESFFGRMASFFNNRTGEPLRSVDSDGVGFSKGDSVAVENTRDIGNKKNKNPDFRQVLKRALHNQPRAAVGRQRVDKQENMVGVKRGRKRVGGAIAFNTHASRSPVHRGDRIEKIRPIGRVKRIGGSD